MSPPARRLRLYHRLTLCILYCPAHLKSCIQSHRDSNTTSSTTSIHIRFNFSCLLYQKPTHTSHPRPPFHLHLSFDITSSAQQRNLLMITHLPPHVRAVVLRISNISPSAGYFSSTAISCSFRVPG